MQGLVYKMTKGPWGETGRAGRGQMLVLGILELDAGSGERMATIAPPIHKPLVTCWFSQALEGCWFFL